MQKPQYDSAIAYALSRLDTEITADYPYHDIVHTRDWVLPTVSRLANLSGCTERETNLLRVGAAFHDMGFVEMAECHELASARVAAQQLPLFHLDSHDIELIMGMILATRLPQSPRTYLEMILADADLTVLADEDFSERNAILRQEVAGLNGSVSDQQWYREQLAFIENHHYFTDVARALFAEGKRANIEELRSRLLAADA